MKKWLLLGGAIVSETAGSLALRAALDHPAWYILVAAGYIGALALLAAVLDDGVGIGLAYGIWAAFGITLTAVFGSLIFDDPFTALMGIGIVVVICGVLLVEIGAQKATEEREADA
ncbi:MAG: SMR family transporter [Solirubrobacterales bacterium]